MHALGIFVYIIGECKTTRSPWATGKSEDCQRGSE